MVIVTDDGGSIVVSIGDAWRDRSDGLEGWGGSIVDSLDEVAEDK